MNFFFSTTTKNYRTKLVIPKFQNSGKIDRKIKLFEANIINDSWCVSECLHSVETENFWYLEFQREIDSIFFLAYEDKCKKIHKNNRLFNIDKFTNTNPDFRANLLVENKLGGFSSYQSEYPFRMTQKLGVFYTECGLLTNNKALRIGLFIRNIYERPIIEEKELFLYNTRDNLIVEKFTINLNKTNYIDLTDFKDELNYSFLIAKQFLGIPIYLLEYEDGSLSFEHTHPPHESILGNNRYKIVNQLKEKAFEKIAQANF